MVAEGTYIENAVLQEGIELLGGMKEDFSTRNALLYPTILQSQDSSPALQIIDVQTESTVVEGFYIEGNLTIDSSDIPVAGSSSIAIHISNSNENLILRDNFISSLNGVDGADGLDGSNGSDGNNGFDGTMSGEVEPTCSGSLASGGIGGTNTCASNDVHGGNGGDLVCPENEVTQNSGSNGLGDSPGDGGLGSCDGSLYNKANGNKVDCACSVSSCWSAGFAGNNGHLGSNGIGGLGSSDYGNWNGTYWENATADDGTLGENGSGGGGGGVGSGVELIDSQCGSSSQYGATGGGGGAGGCGGNAGLGGEGGGSSFGIIMECTSCTSWPILKTISLNLELAVSVVQVVMVELEALVELVVLEV